MPGGKKSPTRASSKGPSPAGRARSTSASARKKSGGGRTKSKSKSRETSPLAVRREPTMFDQAATDNLYYIAHNAVHALEIRGFRSPVAGKKRKKKGGKRKKKG